MWRLLFNPGPTEVREEVLKAQVKPMISHRGKEFQTLYEGIIEKTKRVLNTKNHVVIFTSSATGVMEGTIRNCVKERALGTACGSFSERWFKLVGECDKEGDVISVEWGQAIKPEMIDEKLKTGKYDTILVTYNETSTGVLNPIPEIGEVMKKYPDVIFAVDAVSAMVGAPLKIEEWGIDVVFASVQKCFALPPGLTVTVISEKAYERAKTVKGRGHYFDFVAYIKKYEESKETPATPAVSLLYAIDFQLDRILNEGIENRIKKHQEMSKISQEWAIKREFGMFPEKGYWSPTVSVINNPKGYSIPDLNKQLEAKGYRIANGYGKLKDITFRIGHMGDLTPQETKGLFEAIDEIWGLK
ncbi:MAG: alanine--glyoxylate aminotransferase family protein [Candidatus Hydrothermia bacterium]|nr:alanine--glyoxylate aminotransferase family protein [Candidatus Hydrothermia bacterium]